MKTANELRIEVANKQRMRKTREKWIGFADRLFDIECWQGRTALDDGTKIGDRVGFVDIKPCSGGFNCSQKYGTAFAFGDNHMIVIYRGEMKRIRLKDD